jgi:nucleoside-diphosphate-sugar epimerase
MAADRDGTSHAERPAIDGPVLVTGATGLIGANVCAELLDRGTEVRALVRAGSDATALEKLGVAIARGDVASYADVLAAMDGCTYCIHTAALVSGGPTFTWREYQDANVTGSFNVFDAAVAHSVRRVVSFASAPNPRRVDYAPDAFGDDPYFTAKLAIGQEVLRRAANGQDIVEISPGACYGPAPTGRRAVLPPGFNSRIVRALRGELREMPAFVLSFDLGSEVAVSTVNALVRGTAGERFDLGGREDEHVDTVTFLNIACEHAGLDVKVRALTADELDTPEAAERFGPSVMHVAKLYLDVQDDPPPSPSPGRVAAREVLGHDPAPVKAAVEQTVDWMLAERLLDTPV